MHLAHNEKKYHIQFLQDYDRHNELYKRKPNRRMGLKEPLKPIHVESFFGSDTSTVIQNQPVESEETIIHRDSKKFHYYR